MCDKRNSTHLHVDGGELRIDRCLKGAVEFLNKRGKKTVACCCGHGQYPHTLLIEQDDGRIKEYYSERIIHDKPRRNYYKKDESGFYFIPKFVIIPSSDKEVK